MTNDRAFVDRVLGLFRSRGIDVELVGGWRLELDGKQPPWPHSDVDVRCDPENAARVDALIATYELDEVLAKRRAEKRAFVLDDVLVEVHLAERRWPPARPHVALADYAVGQSNWY